MLSGEGMGEVDRLVVGGDLRPWLDGELSQNDFIFRDSFDSSTVVWHDLCSLNMLLMLDQGIDRSLEIYLD